MTLRDLSAKDVIQLKTGENLGRIDDVVFDEHGGRLQSVILRGRAHCFGLLGCDDDLILPWESIRTIGTDVIMVDAGPLPGARRRSGVILAERDAPGLAHETEIVGCFIRVGAPPVPL